MTSSKTAALAYALFDREHGIVSTVSDDEPVGSATDRFEDVLLRRGYVVMGIPSLARIEQCGQADNAAVNRAIAEAGGQPVDGLRLVLGDEAIWRVLAGHTVKVVCRDVDTQTPALIVSVRAALGGESDGASRE